MGIVISAIKIIFLLGFLIFIHEGGHFTVAKLCRVKVNQFSIGFGPIIWSYQSKETKYTLRLIPLGGFVSMEGEEEDSDEKGAFNKASIFSRIAIVSAGALVNIVFGIALYFILIIVIYNSFDIAFLKTGQYFVALIESLKLLFTGNVSVNDLTGPVGISGLITQTSRNCRICLYFINDICFFRNYKFIANTCT